MRKPKWNELQLKALDDSILLWGKMASIKTKKTNKTLAEFKLGFCKKLGLGSPLFGCPLCDLFCMNFCINCPITIKSGGGSISCQPYSPYGEYVKRYKHSKFKSNHSQPKARVFLNYLIRLKKEGE